MCKLLQTRTYVTPSTYRPEATSLLLETVFRHCFNFSQTHQVHTIPIKMFAAYVPCNTSSPKNTYLHKTSLPPVLASTEVFSQTKSRPDAEWYLLQ